MKTTIDPIQQIEELERIKANAEAQLLAAENRQYVLAREYIDQGENLEERLKLASFLYWNADAIKPSILCQAFDIKSVNKKGYELLLTHSAPMMRTICINCDKRIALVPTSRSHRQYLLSKARAANCHDCRRKQDEEAEIRVDAEVSHCLERLKTHKLMSMAKKKDFSGVSNYDLVSEGIHLIMDATYCGHLDMTYYELGCTIRNFTELKAWTPNKQEIDFVKEGLMAIELF